MPRFSVLIPVHNGAAFIERSVRSALAQSERDLEVLVIDDGSTDTTPAIMEGLARTDDRIKLLRTPRNGGPALARNIGLDHAAGAWIALLDADDWFQPDRLERLGTRAERSRADMVSDNLLIWADGATSGEPMFDPQRELPERISAETFVLGNLPDYEAPRAGMGFLKPILRADFLTRSRLRYREDMRFAEDYQFYLECLLAGGHWVTDSTVSYIYVVRAASLTAAHGAPELKALCEADERALARPEVSVHPALERALRHHLVSVQQRLHWVLFYQAVKARRFVAAARHASLNGPVFQFIAQNCVEQAKLRTLRRLGR